jgi:hypothetical protein
MFDLIKRNLLKYTLLVDGIVSVFAGAAFLAFSALVAELIGPAFTGGIIMGLGAFLFVWGLFHLAMSSRDAPPVGGVQVAIIGDALWVLGSIGVLVVDWNGLTAIGAAFIAVLTVAVTDIMLLKMKGLSDRRRAVVA